MYSAPTLKLDIKLNGRTNEGYILDLEKEKNTPTPSHKNPYITTF